MVSFLFYPANLQGFTELYLKIKAVCWCVWRKAAAFSVSPMNMCHSRNVPPLPNLWAFPLWAPREEWRILSLQSCRCPVETLHLPMVLGWEHETSKQMFVTLPEASIFNKSEWEGSILWFVERQDFPRLASIYFKNCFLKHLWTYFKSLIHPILTLNTSCAFKACHYLMYIYYYLWIFWTTQHTDKPNSVIFNFQSMEGTFPLSVLGLIVSPLGLSTVKIVLIWRVSKKAAQTGYLESNWARNLILARWNISVKYQDRWKPLVKFCWEKCYWFCLV